MGVHVAPPGTPPPNPLAGVADTMRQLSEKLAQQQPRRYVPNRADRRKAARGKRTA